MFEDAFGYNAMLPEEIREIFMWLCQDVASVYHKWRFYMELFGSEENTELLSYLAPGCFNIIEESLRGDMTMAICRLSDPARSMGKDNLSLSSLIERCGDIEGVEEPLRHFLIACGPVRFHRNKRVGHNDLETTIKPRENPLPGIGRRQIDEILSLASEILNTIYQSYVDGELAFGHSLCIGGADALLYWLKLGRQYQAEQDTRVRESLQSQRGGSL
jgi:hypothetical protein